MKLTVLERELLRRVRDTIAESSSSYICVAASEQAFIARDEDLKRWQNRLKFWSFNKIRDKWILCERSIHAAVRIALRGQPTIGEWFENSLREDGVEINTPVHMRNQRGLYAQIRLAWLDRALETGEIK